MLSVLPARRLLLLSLVALASSQTTAAAKSPLLRATIDDTAPGRTIPRSFVGFSYEPAFVPQYIGGPGAGTNPVAVQLFANLSRGGNGPPVLRVGGGGTDNSWYNAGGLPRPKGITYDIKPAWLEGLGAFLKRTGSRTILGVNFARNDPAVATAFAKAATDALPRRAISAFEIGNEPDIYTTRPLYYDGDGTEHFARPRSYDFADYLGELGRFTTALRRAVPGIRLAGPSACCKPRFVEGLPQLLRRLGSRLRLVTFHWYPLARCELEPGDRKYPRPFQLLSTDVLLRALTFHRAAAQSRSKGLPFRVTETNSVACGGAYGTSDTFASSLWSVDWLFSLAAVGVSGADFHSVSPVYRPISIGYDGTRFLGKAHPLYYGMLMFTEATQRGARLLPRVSLRAVPRKRTNVRIWATLDRRRTARVVVLDKELRRSGGGVVELRVPGATGPASLSRLSAPRLGATTGVTWEGQAVGDLTTTGRLEGPRTREAIRPRKGVYRFSLDRSSAAMLTIRRLPRR